MSSWLFAGVMLEYPGLKMAIFIQKHDVTNRLNSHVAGRVSRIVCCGCASRSFQIIGAIVRLPVIDLLRACHDNVVGSEADTKVPDCDQSSMT